MPYTKWVVGARPTAAQTQAWEDSYVRCTSTTRPADADRTDGMIIREVDTGNVFIALGNGVAAVWVPYGAVLSWTPVIKQGTSTLGIASNSSTYLHGPGRLVTAHYAFNVNATGTAGQEITLSLPTATSTEAVGNIAFINLAGDYAAATLLVISGTEAKLLRSTVGAFTDQMTVGVQIKGSITYTHS